MKYGIYALTFLLTLSGGVFGQKLKPSRLSVEANAGIPIIISSVTPALATYGGVGIRYSLSAALSVQTSFNIGIMRGAQNVAAADVAEEQKNYVKYHNSFIQYTLRGQINLERVFKLRASMRKLNPFLTGGIGYTGTMGIEAERSDGRLRKYTDIDFWTVQTGIVVRYYLNPTLDLNIGSELNLTQTKFLDGIPLDDRFDHFVMTYVGINVKIGTKRRNQHIEWINHSRRNRVPSQKKDDPDDHRPNLVLKADDPDQEHADSFLEAKIAEQNAAKKALAEKQAAAAAANAGGKSPELNTPTTPAPTQGTPAGNTVDGAFAGAKSALGIKRGANAVASTSGIAAPATGSMTTGADMAGTPASGTTVGRAGDKTTTGAAITPGMAGAAGRKTASHVQHTGTAMAGNKLALTGKTASGILATAATATGKNGSTASRSASSQRSQTVASGKSNVGTAGKDAVTGTYTASPLATSLAKVHTPVDPHAPTLNFIEGVTPPGSSYNVIVGAFRKSKNAYAFRNKMRKMGYQCAIFRSDIDSRIMRVCVYSTNNKEIAVKQLEKARAEVEKGSWVHVYTKK